MEPLYKIDTILEMLTKQPFADFYCDEGEFGLWITGYSETLDRDDITEKLRKLLEHKI